MRVFERLPLAPGGTQVACTEPYRVPRERRRASGAPNRDRSGDASAEPSRLPSEPRPDRGRPSRENPRSIRDRPDPSRVRAELRRGPWEGSGKPGARQGSKTTSLREARQGGPSWGCLASRRTDRAARSAAPLSAAEAPRSDDPRRGRCEGPAPGLTRLADAPRGPSVDGPPLEPARGPRLRQKLTLS